MSGEEWTEPAQQTNPATKEILTAANDRAEKATACQSHKDTSFSIKAERSTDSVASKGQKDF